MPHKHSLTMIVVFEPMDSACAMEEKLKQGGIVVKRKVDNGSEHRMGSYEIFRFGPVS